MTLWSAPGTGMLDRLAQWLHSGDFHPGRILVLLPYAQLLPLARRLWSERYPQGFAPRFETTSNWLATLGTPPVLATDICHDMALDSLTARQLLTQGGMADRAALAGLLAQSAQQLAPFAAAAGPQGREDWAAAARKAVGIGMESQAVAWEAQMLRVAVEWAAISAYPTDVLFEQNILETWDAVAWVQGISEDPVTTALATRWGERARLFKLDDADPIDVAEAADATSPVSPMFPGSEYRLHACVDAEDEAQRAAACAVAHVAADRYPVALVSSDRALTRRIRAMLESAGIAMRDENGWKLSTSLAGAGLMALLKAAAWNATADDVLNAFKLTPAFNTELQALERVLRRAQIRDWRDVALSPLIKKQEALRVLCQRIDAVRHILAGSRPLAAWLAALHEALQATGQWDACSIDEAGTVMLAALRLTPAEPSVWADYLDAALWAGNRLDAAEFTAWVHQVLESHSFQPAYPDEEQVVILPMSQMMARPFAAVVLVGCDEMRLNPSPEPVGVWTPAQREALGMPSRTVMEQRLRAAWGQALLAPVCDVLWRTSDDAGEHLAPSAMVQGIALAGHAGTASGLDLRAQQTVALRRQEAPQARGDALPVLQLSASAYEDMRTCPYRFFAMRQLGLHAADELEAEVDKRDFGVWLHAVLNVFHADLQAAPTSDPDLRSTRLQAAAEAVTASLQLPEGEFLPFAASWPAVRQGYLRWLHAHEAEGWRFAEGEQAYSQSAGPVTLVGRVDRTDTGPDGAVYLLDYKTEPLGKTRERVKTPMEDTQIAFYAALLPQDQLRGAYVNIGERDGTVPQEQPLLVEVRDALVEGIVHDMQRVAQGHALAALGEGPACDYCHARGLCRKDFWSGE
jgi:ATP-dependent helicase/nuclease subunit B